MIKLSKPILLISGVAVLLIIGVIIFAAKRGHAPSPILKEEGPRIVKVSPEDGTEDIPITTSIEIVFDEPVKKDSLKYSIDPSREMAKTADEDLLTVFLSPLPSFEPGTQYIVDLTWGSSSYSFEFKTSEEITEGDEITLQTEYDTKFNEAADEYERTHPLLELMPVEKDLFKIEYKGEGLYEYTLKGTSKKQALETMLAWWEENKVNPDELNLKERGL